MCYLFFLNISNERLLDFMSHVPRLLFLLVLEMRNQQWIFNEKNTGTGTGYPFALAPMSLPYPHAPYTYSISMSYSMRHEIPVLMPHPTSPSTIPMSHTSFSCLTQYPTSQSLSPARSPCPVLIYPTYASSLCPIPTPHRQTPSHTHHYAAFPILISAGALSSGFSSLFGRSFLGHYLML